MRVHGVDPGLVPTDMGTVKDMAIAGACRCSDAARFITGAGLPVDGGKGM